MFVRDFGEGAEARTQTARENNAFHFSDSLFAEPSTPGVLALVVNVELAGFHGPPPSFVRPVPRDGFRQARCERDPRFPAQRANLSGIEGVAAIVSGAIRHMPHVRFPGARCAREAAR
jgi:hypothetical protein